MSDPLMLPICPFDSDIACVCGRRCFFGVVQNNKRFILQACENFPIGDLSVLRLFYQGCYGS